MVERERPGLMGRIGPTGFVAFLLLAASALVLSALVLVEPNENDMQSPPDVTFVQNETRDALRVNTTEEGVVWNDLQVKMNKPGSFMVQGDENVSRAEPMVFQRIANESQIEEGDRLGFCLDNGDRELEVTLLHADSETVMNTFRFVNVASCTPEEEEEGGAQEEAREEGDEDEDEDEEGEGEAQVVADEGYASPDA